MKHKVWSEDDSSSARKVIYDLGDFFSFTREVRNDDGSWRIIGEKILSREEIICAANLIKG